MHLNFSPPRLLWRLVLGQTLKRFLGGEIFLITALMLGDLFSTMWKLLALEAPLGRIVAWILMGIPSHASQVLPVAFLFAVTLTIATMYSDGELIVINGAGVSIQKLALPLVLISAALSAVLFLSKDFAEVPLANERVSLYDSMTGQASTQGRLSDVALMTDSGNVIYRAASYNATSRRLARPDIVIRSGLGALERRIIAAYAEWDGSRWAFYDARILSNQSEEGFSERFESMYVDENLAQSPDAFLNLKADPELMRTGELRTYIQFLDASGLPSVDASTELHKRYSFVLTPLIVSGLSIAFGGIFKKNSLLMSLLFSLGVATVYYVAQMLGSISAKTGWVRPGWGIWSVTILFLIISASGFAKAKT